MPANGKPETLTRRSINLLRKLSIQHAADRYVTLASFVYDKSEKKEIPHVKKATKQRTYFSHEKCNAKSGYDERPVLMGLFMSVGGSSRRLPHNDTRDLFDDMLIGQHVPHDAVRGRVDDSIHRVLEEG